MRARAGLLCGCPQGRRRMLSASLLCGCPQGKAREEEPEQAAYGNGETGRAAQAQSPGGRKGFVFVDKHRLRRDGDFFLSVYSLIQKKFFFLRRALKNNCAASQVTVRKNNCIQRVTQLFFFDRDSYCHGQKKIIV